MASLARREHAFGEILRLAQRRLCHGFLHRLRLDLRRQVIAERGPRHFDSERPVLRSQFHCRFA